MLTVAAFVGRGRVRVLLLTGLLILVMSLPGCAVGGQPVRTVRIALVVPVAHETIGEQFIQAAELGLEEAGHRVGNVEVELLILDNGDPDPGGNPYSIEREIEAAQQAIDDPLVVAYIGPPTTGQARESIPMLNRAGIVQIGIAATWPGLTQTGYDPGEPGVYYPTGRRTFFRLFSGADVRASASLEYAIREYGISTAYAVDDGTAYGNGIVGVYNLVGGDLGIETIDHDGGIDLSEEALDEDINALASRIAEANPDALYFGATVRLGRGAELLTAVRELDPDIVILGTEGVIDLPSTGVDLQLLEGSIMTLGVVGNPERIGTEEALRFAAAYEATYGEPVLHPYTVTIYEATRVFLYAIEHAEEPTREGVLLAVENLGTYSGVMGDWSFTPEGDLGMVMAEISELRNGEWEVVEAILEERGSEQIFE